jgi:hypothetical protein
MIHTRALHESSEEEAEKLLSTAVAPFRIQEAMKNTRVKARLFNNIPHKPLAAWLRAFLCTLFRRGQPLEQAQLFYCLGWNS